MINLDQHSNAFISTHNEQSPTNQTHYHMMNGIWECIYAPQLVCFGVCSCVDQSIP